MNTLLEQFHFLRPAWLLLLLPMLFLLAALYRKASSGANWRRAIASELVDYLLEPGQQQRRHWIWLLAGAWLLATLALAGPTWEKTPQPVLQKRDALVMVLDLSLSMYAEDIQPSRLERARYKILDILKQRREGLTGLVVYSGDAHVVSPLTDDTATIANLVPALAPAMMPSYGSDAVAGIEQAIQLLRNAGFERGRILLLSDEISAANIDDIAKKIGSGAWQLSIMGIGTDQGAPIPTRDGFLKNDSGSIAVAQLHRENFQVLTQKTGARYSDLQLDDSDINKLLADNFSDARAARTLQREFDQWRERGPQLVMLLLPLAALAFRRGWLLILFLLPFSAPSQAQDWHEQWRDLWQRPDQQAQQLFSAGDSKNAAQKFSDPAWRAAAQYRSGNYENAAQTLADQQSADAHYNRGNALAQMNKLQDAIAAYDAALKASPALEDAQFNRELVKKLLQQQQNQPQNQPQQKDGQQNDNSQQQKSSQRQSGGGGQQQKDDSQKTSPAEQSSGAAKNQTAQSTQSRSKDNQSEKDDATAQQQANASGGNKNADQQSSKQSAAAAAESPEQQLQQRATEQWLRQIPDDPAGLLRRKFLYEHRQRERDAAPRSDQPIW